MTRTTERTGKRTMALVYIDQLPLMAATAIRVRSFMFCFEQRRKWGKETENGKRKEMQMNSKKEGR